MLLTKSFLIKMISTI